MSENLPATTSGRSSLARCTPEVIDTVTDYLRNKGLTRSLAARAVGISPGTLAKWMKRGESGEQPFYDLFVRVGQAEAMAAAEAAERVISIAKDVEVEPQHRLKADTFLLERVHGLAAKSEVAVEHKDGENDGREPKYDNLTPELLETFEFLVRLLEASPAEVPKLMESPPPWLNLPKAQQIVDAEFETVDAEEVASE